MKPSEVLTDDGVTLAGELLFVDSQSRPRACVIFAPGGIPVGIHSDSAREASGMIAIAEKLADNGIHSFLFDGRGMGNSRGRRQTQWDTVLDLEAVIHFVNSEFGSDSVPLGIFAHSAGGASAFQIASQISRVRSICCYGTLPSYKKAQEDGRLTDVIREYWQKSDRDLSFEEFITQYGALNPIDVASTIQAHILLCGGSEDPRYFRFDEQLELASQMIHAKSIAIACFHTWKHHLSRTSKGFEQIAAMIANWFYITMKT